MSLSGNFHGAVSRAIDAAVSRHPFRRHAGISCLSARTEGALPRAPAQERRGLVRAHRRARAKTRRRGIAQFARNYNFFGAPVGMFFFLDRTMGPPQWSDLGMFIQNIMLLAREIRAGNLRAGILGDLARPSERILAASRRS